MTRQAKQRNRCVSVPLNKEMFNFLDGYCERTGQPKASVLRAMIVDWKKREELKSAAG